MARRAVAGAALLCVVASCRTHVAPVVLPAVRAEVGHVAGVRACWVEFASSLGFTASGILVHHPKGTLLIDVGQSRAFHSEIGGVPLTQRPYLRAVPGALVGGQPAADVLRQAGVEPTALRWIIPTHVHSDHLGGVMDLPPVPVLLSPAEATHLRNAASQQPFNVMPQHAAHIAHNVTTLAFDRGPYEVFGKHADIMEDGSVVVVPLEGHTPGSVGVYINTARGRLFNAGDAINDMEALDGLRGKQFYLAPTDNNAHQADHQVAVLAALHAFSPTLAILPAHQRTQWVRVFGAPGGCVQ